MEFHDKIVLVTGAAVGIGRETASAFAAEGATVIVNYSRSEQEALETCRVIRESGGRAYPIQADVSQEDDVLRMMREIESRFGHLDILVNNAGITDFIPFPDLDKANAEVWDRLYNVNVKGVFFCCREAAKLMSGRNGANIVNLSSQAGMRAMGSSIPYSVSKAAVIHLTQCLAVALAPGIRVNCVSPGVIENTRWNAGRKDFSPEENRRENSAHIPLRRLGQPKDVAEAILFLAGKGDYCNGTILPVDGGRIIV